MSDFVSYAQNPTILRRARDFYAVYCASSDGKNYQGLPCPEWDNLTDAVRRHWYTVALRSLQLEAVADPQGVAAGVTIVGDEHKHPPNDYVIAHLSPHSAHALDVWRSYSGAP